MGILNREDNSTFNSQFHTLAQAIPEVIITIDDNSTIIFINKSAEKIFGYKIEEMIGQKVTMLMPYDLRPIHLSSFNNFIKTGKKNISWESVKVSGLHKDGRIIHLEISFLEFTENGRNFFTALIRDITESKLIEEKLKKLNEQLEETVLEKTKELKKVNYMLEGIFESLEQQSFWSFDIQESKLLYISPGTEKVYSYPTEAFKNNANLWKEVVHPDDLYLIEKTEQQTANGMPTDSERRIIHKDGSVHWIRVQTMPILDPDGKVIYLNGMTFDITKQKIAEQLLRESERRLNQAQKITHIGSWERDILTGKNIWSDELYHIFELQPQEFGKLKTLDNFLNFVYVEDKQLFIESIEKALKIKESFSIEYRINKPDGTIRTVFTNGEFITDNENNPVKIIGTTQDITERKEIEATLHEIETRYRDSFDHAVIGMTLNGTMNGNYLQVNNSFCKMLGYTEEELLSTNALDLTYPEDKDLSHEYYQQLIKGKSQTVHFEKRYIHKSGKPVWVRINTSVIRDLKGNILYFITQIEDITKQKITGQLLRESESKNRALVNAIPDLIFTLSKDGVFLDYNAPEGSKLLFSPDTFLGKSIYEIIPTIADKTMLNIKKAFETNVVQAFEYQLTVNNILSDWEARIVSSGDEVIVIVRDITEKKRMESQFLRAQRMESIGTLTGGIAHDLNNVLAPIMMAVEILKMNPPDKKRNEILSTLESSVKRGSDIIKQLLIFARGEADKEHTVVHIDQLTGNITQIIERTFPKSIILITSIPDNLWSVTGDITQLEQMLLNLCVNARDAMPDGGVLTILAENIIVNENSARMNIDAKVGSYVSIEISDSGSGIPPEIIDKIFEPFFTTKEIGKGTGLGLSSLTGIVKSHGGFVNLISKVGEGTKFNIYIPAGKSIKVEQLADEQIELLRGNGELILIIDDEISIIEILKTTLETFGYNILTAENGMDATRIYKENKNMVKVILTDVSMPVMDGLSTAKALKLINPLVKVIIASGLTTDKKATEIAGNEILFLQKPYTTADLLKKIKDIL